ncbi:MAG TPA: hypothetical protein VGF17_17970 [Phytomonospora sp.]
MAKPDDDNEEYRYPPKKFFDDLGTSSDDVGSALYGGPITTIKELGSRLPGAANPAAPKSADGAYEADGTGTGAGGIFGEVPAALDTIVPKIRASLERVTANLTGVHGQLDEFSVSVPDTGKSYDGTEKNNTAEVEKARAMLDKTPGLGTGKTTA